MLPDNDAAPLGPVPDHPTLQLGIRLSTATEMVLRDYNVRRNSRSLDALCALLRQWRHDESEAHVAAHARQPGSKEAVTRAAANWRSRVISAASPNPEADNDHDTLAQRVGELIGLLEGVREEDRAVTALRIASDMVEFAGYAAALRWGSREVVPTFLLAQSVQGRADTLKRAVPVALEERVAP